MELQWTFPTTDVHVASIPEQNQQTQHLGILLVNVPTKSQLQSSNILSECQLIPIAANATTLLPSSFPFLWASVMKATEAIRILVDSGRRAKRRICGRTWDYSKLFQLLSIRYDANWKSIIAFVDDLWSSTRAETRHVLCAHAYYRMKILLTSLLKH